jgi:hypothetical protein
MNFFDFRVMMEICFKSSERLQQQIDYDDGSFELNGAVGGGRAACVRVSPRIIIIAIGGTHCFSFPSYPCPNYRRMASCDNRCRQA